ncbi:keratin, type I cytoskeletal 18-like [Astyanax mexicanus]|uniref:Keratin, type I cytoskeletal 18-like n=1 Tax=Astyanax mexicanus TaxID=7994 RepID=A0A8T2LDF4_ASTMX|nr:keratin, type I cytoskeletal 18-like [Astyanax mexicanus]
MASARFFRSTVPHGFRENYTVSTPIFHTMGTEIPSLGGSRFLSEDLHRSSYASVELAVSNEKETMQNLNDRLGSYLEKVRILEEANSKLEVQIREAQEGGSPEVRDYSRFETTITQLRKEILEATLANAQIVLHIDNSGLALEDFKTKFESELHSRENVESDIRDLRKILDGTNVSRLHLENDVETLNEQLITLKKSHKEEIAEMHGQIAQSGVQVEVDAPKGQNLGQIMEEMRAKYEKIALENQAELKAWHESKIEVVQVQVTESSAALKEARAQSQEERKRMQTLEIELQTQNGLKASLEGSLEEVQLHCNMQIQQHNTILLQREAELKELRSTIQKQMQDYSILLSLKVELEAEIETYKKLLDGGEEPTSNQLRINLMNIRY